MRILLVEDDISLASSTTQFLRRGGFVVDHADSLEIAKIAVEDNQFDIVLLDRRLPDGEGLSLIEYCERRNLPQRFIILTALDEVDDRVYGLESGALDYLTKPFEPSELQARIRNALRFPVKREHHMVSFGALHFDPEARNFTIGDEPLILSRAQFLVLEALMARPGAVVHKETLSSRVYGYDADCSPNSLEAQISRLRKSLSQKTPDIEVATLRGIGYTLRRVEDGERPN